MRRALTVLCVLLFAAVAFAAPDVRQGNIPVFPKTLLNARYVYVTSYDGAEFNPNILPEDRAAISNVQSALQQWGRYTVVYRPQEADMIVAVQSRPSEDVLAVYDPQIRGTYLWRAMGRDGLQKGETPLVNKLQDAVKQASK
jgi:hypothetical protein